MRAIKLRAPANPTAQAARRHRSSFVLATTRVSLSHPYALSGTPPFGTGTGARRTIGTETKHDISVTWHSPRVLCVDARTKCRARSTCLLPQPLVCRAEPRYRLDLRYGLRELSHYSRSSLESSGIQSTCCDQFEGMHLHVTVNGIRLLHDLMRRMLSRFPSLPQNAATPRSVRHSK